MTEQIAPKFIKSALADYDVDVWTKAGNCTKRNVFWQLCEPDPRDSVRGRFFAEWSPFS